MESDEAEFQAFDAYDFDHDQDFQAGLQKLAGSSDSAQLLQAKIFYYSRSKAPIDLNAYKRWKATHVDTRAPLDEQLKSKDGSPTCVAYSPSFAQVVQMIANGEEIPGIRDIPDQLNQEQPSKSTACAPPKPWEQQQPQ
ncbi:hypothetical protein LPJ54_004849 [Coemansia sp. RSA 1824]|nr:hypothetical protein LPJ54_004849 [Coemansia sp. RSA 1824]